MQKGDDSFKEVLKPNRTSFTSPKNEYGVDKYSASDLTTFRYVLVGDEEEQVYEGRFPTENMPPDSFELSQILEGGTRVFTVFESTGEFNELVSAWVYRKRGDEQIEF